MREPWSDIGRLQQETNSLKHELHRKADDYTVHEAMRKMGSLEHSLREVSSDLAELSSRIEALESYPQQKEGLNE